MMSQPDQPVHGQEDDDERAAMEDDVAEYNRKMNEDLRNAKLEQERLAFTLSRFSPASAYQLTAMNLGGTNTSIKKRYEDQLYAYRETFMDYVEKKQAEEREERVKQAQKQQQGGRMMVFLGSGSEPIDASDMPRFVPQQQSLAAVLKPSMVDFGLLAMFTIVAFAGAFVAFVRYDVR